MWLCRSILPLLLLAALSTFASASIGNGGGVLTVQVAKGLVGKRIVRDERELERLGIDDTTRFVYDSDLNSYGNVMRADPRTFVVHVDDRNEILAVTLGGAGLA